MIDRIKQNHCINCGKQIDKRSKRCKTCSTQDPEYRHKKSVAMKTLWQDPNYRQKVSGSLKAAHARGDFDNPETLRKQSEAAKAAHARGDFDNPRIRHKMSVGVKAAWARGIYDGPETRRKMSDSSKMNWRNPEYRRKHIEVIRAMWQTPEHRCKVSQGISAAYQDNPELRRKASETTKARWARGSFDGLFQSPTSIELKVMAALNICGIRYESQYRPNGYSRVYDMFVSPNILIEVHGDYFHSEENFPGITKRDAEKARWAKENDHHLIVMWEHEIEEQGAWALVHERILTLLE